MVGPVIREWILWVKQTPDRALRAAQDAADSFQKVRQESQRYENLRGGSEPTVLWYLEQELRQYERTVQIRLREFRVSSAILQPITKGLDGSLDQILILDWKSKVEAIEDVISSSSSSSQIPFQTTKPLAFEKTGVVPRSIPRTFDRLRRELLPSAESLVVQEFRVSRYQTLAALQFIASLIWVPWLVAWLTRVWLLQPAMTVIWNTSQHELFLHRTQEEKVLGDMRAFQDKVYFEVLVGEAPDPSPDALQARLEAKARDLAEVSNQNSIDSLTNLGSDALACLTLVLMLSFGKAQIAVLKSFLDELIYSLSDATKAFLIILCTDIFVGFHSPHGWEVLLEMLLAHLGLPESKKFIFLFVATFPVLLDTVFKYWIFRYLNQISPSAVATYRNMNE
jgi:hypothetical protein